MHAFEIGIFQQTQFAHQLRPDPRIFLQIDLLVKVPQPLLLVQVFLFPVDQLLLIVQLFELLIVFKILFNVSLPLQVLLTVVVTVVLVTAAALRLVLVALRLLRLRQRLRLQRFVLIRN